MSVPVRLATFAVAIAAAFGIGFSTGAVAGPFDKAPTHDMAPVDHGTQGQHTSGEERR